MDIIKRIEELRLERNWSKYELAEEATLTYSTLSSMYQRNTPPKIDVLEMLCSAFKISLSQFFIENEEIEVVNKEEKTLLNNYRKLSTKKKNAVLALTEN